MRRVYVAGPYTSDTPEGIDRNVKNAIEVADRLSDCGFAPFVPHLCHFWNLHRPRSYHSWIEMDLAWLEGAQAVLRMPGKSVGADGEVRRAVELGIPVFYTIDEMIRTYLP